MERPHWHFDSKCHKESKEQQHLLNDIQARIMPSQDVKGIGDVVQVQHGNQSEQWAKQGVQEEFKCCVNMVVIFLDTNDDVHRNQSCLEEYIEQQSI